MNDIEFLKEEAQEEIFFALHCDCGECYKDARDAVKAFAKEAGISTTEAWLYFIQGDRDYAQEVINDVRKDAAKSGEDELKRVLSDFGVIEDLTATRFSWDVRNDPDFSGLTGEDLNRLFSAVVRENRFREAVAQDAAMKASGEAYAETLDAYAQMTGAELKEEVGAYAAEKGRDVLNRPWDDLKARYDEIRSGHALDADFNHLRRPFCVSADVPWDDVWTFPVVPVGRENRHPCEKPVPLLSHIVRSATRPGDLILDCFAGSGSLAEAAIENGRRVVLFERDPRWVAASADRIRNAEAAVAAKAEGGAA